MPWPPPNKRVHVLLTLAALCAMQVSLGDTPVEQASEETSLASVSADLSEKARFRQ